MAKKMAVLTFPMPTSCVHCPVVRDALAGQLLYCGAGGHTLREIESGAERPKWCPLKEAGSQ